MRSRASRSRNNQRRSVAGTVNARREARAGCDRCRTSHSRTWRTAVRLRRSPGTWWRVLGERRRSGSIGRSLVEFKGVQGQLYLHEARDDHHDACHQRMLASRESQLTLDGHVSRIQTLFLVPLISTVHGPLLREGSISATHCAQVLCEQSPLQVQHQQLGLQLLDSCVTRPGIQCCQYSPGKYYLVYNRWRRGNPYIGGTNGKRV